jgi:hypothetical protein
MSEDKGTAFFVAKIGYPVPGEDAFYGNDDILTKGSDGFKKGITVGFQVAMSLISPFSSRMQIYSLLVLFGPTQFQMYHVLGGGLK